MIPSWFTRDIYPGDAGRDVIALQAALGVPQSGVLDDYTEAYVRGVQRVAKKKTDGIVDDETAAVIGERERTKAGLAPSWFEHDACFGHHCPCVLHIRNVLEVPHVGQPDFDERLESAVKRFQGTRGLKVTGCVDKETAVAIGE